MNDAILNADLPMSLRLKRANRRGWRIDRPDNIRFVVEAARAYRQLAAPQPWEATFEYNRAQPVGNFGDESFDLYSEAFVYQQELEELEQQTPYPGIGNRIAKLQSTIDDLYRMSRIRHEESIMIGLPKGKLIKVVEIAKIKELEGYADLPTKREMEAKVFLLEDVTRLLAENLGLTAAQVAHFANEIPVLTTSLPSTRSMTPRRQSPPRVRSPSRQSSPGDVAEGRSSEDDGSRYGLDAFAEEWFAKEWFDGVESQDEMLQRVASRSSPGGFDA